LIHTKNNLNDLLFLQIAVQSYTFFPDWPNFSGIFEACGGLIAFISWHFKRFQPFSRPRHAPFRLTRGALQA